MKKSFMIAMCIAAGLMVLAMPNAARADLAMGDYRVNPDSALSGTHYTEGSVPSNYSSLVASMTNAFSGDFVGDVTSKVWMDPSTDYLAFEYYFTVDTATTPLRSATIGSNWSDTTVFEVGADGSGSSSGNWTDGDPLTLGRLPASGSGAPSIVYSSLFAPDGTDFTSGEYSSHFWYATNATVYVVTDLDALDGGLSAEAPVYAVPAPGALLLGVMGLGLAGWVRRKIS